VSIAYQSGTVSWASGFPFVNADGGNGVDTANLKGSSGDFFPTYYMSTIARTMGQHARLNAVITDNSGQLLANQAVTFTVTGANPQQYQTTTDSTGTANFDYQGFVAGEDVVQAQTEVATVSISSSAMLNWTTTSNQPPFVTVGGDQTITLPTNSVMLSGTAVDDGLPNGTLTTTWTQTIGPSGGSLISSPNQLSTQVLFTQPGTYTFELTASDSSLMAIPAVTHVTVVETNQPPVISIAANRTTIVLSDTVVVTGSVSDDGRPQGSTTTAGWTKAIGPGNVTFSNPSSPNTTISFDATGDYVLRLTASDTDKVSFVDLPITVNAEAPNQAPVVSIDPAPTSITLPANVITLHGNVTDDGRPANGSLTVQWEQVSNGSLPVTFSSPTSAITQVGFPTSGVYELKLCASDSQLSSCTSSISVTVNSSASATNQAPLVAIHATQTGLLLPLNSTVLTAIVNDDGLPNGHITLQWSQGPGSPAASFSQTSGPSTTVVAFPQAGVYAIQLTANDGQLSTTASVNIIVTNPGGNQPPTVNAGANQTVEKGSSPVAVTLNGYAADDGMPTGSSLAVTWSVIDGPPSDVTFADPHSAATTVTFSQAGMYVLELTASDSQYSPTSTVSIDVEDQPGASPTVQLLVDDGTVITAPTTINGSVSGGNWTLKAGLVGGDGTVPTDQLIPINSGSAQISGAVGTLDPTMVLNGTYRLILSTQDQWGQTASTSVTVDVEQNLKLGNFTLSFNDLSVPMPGLPIQITRTYDTRNKSKGDFGYGWTLSIANVRVSKSQNLGQNWYEDVTWQGYSAYYCVSPATNRTVSLTFPDGRVYKFQAALDTQCQTDVPLTDGFFAFTQLPTGSSTAGAKLEVDGDSTARQITVAGSVPGPVDVFGYDGNFFDATKYKLTTAEGFIYYVDAIKGVTKLQDPNSNTITIDDNGVTHSAGQSIQFVRQNGPGTPITSIEDPLLNSIVYGYDPTTGDLLTVVDRDHHVTTFTYDSTHPHYLSSIQYTKDDGTLVTALTNQYDPQTGRLLSTMDASGGTINYDPPDFTSNQQTIKSGRGFPTVYTFDNDGNVKETDDPEGGITYANYDSNDNKVEEWNNYNPLAAHTLYTYDSLGNQTSVQDPLGHVTRYTYTSRKQVQDIFDPNGNQTHNEYDEATGNLTSTVVVGSGVAATSYNYLSGGLVESITDPQNIATHFTYDGNGNLASQTVNVNGVDITTSFSFDANGRKQWQKIDRTKADNTKETLTTSYGYTDAGLLTSTTYPDGTSTAVEYNTLGKQKDTQDANGNHTQYLYYPDGHLQTVTYSDGTTEQYTYDADGNKETYQDRGGHVTKYCYDKTDRLKKTIAPADNTFTETDYDYAGRVTRTVDANTNVTTYGYDDANRRTSIIEGDGANEARTTTFGYDAAGNQISVTDGKGNVTYYDYDALNRQYRIRYPDNTQELSAFDGNGRVTDKYDQAGQHTLYGYDELGRLRHVYQAYDTLQLHTSYEYDEVGNRISQTDATTVHTTKFAYDKMGRRQSRTLPDGASTESYAYDNNGNLKTRTDFNGHQTQYFYDTLNRLTCKTPSSSPDQATACADARAVNFTYTATGRRATMTDPSGTTTYHYNDRDRLEWKLTPFGQLNYTYDNAGDVQSIASSNTNGASMTYGYDHLNRLQSVTVPGQSPTTYSYDPAGNLGGYAYPNGVSTTYVNYDSLNRLTEMGSAKGTTVLAHYMYTLGDTGNRIKVVEASGRTVQYGYDDIYRLNAEIISGDTHSTNGVVVYTYDNVGNRKQLNSTLGAVPPGNWNYDADDRLTVQGTSDPAYDANGNTIALAGILNTYDFENHLAQHGAVSIVYDGDGNRVSETVGGVRTNYLVDTQNPTGYAQVMEELQSGAVVRRYTWGQWLIAKDEVGDTTQTSYYGYDGHGSMRFLTDTSGAVTDTYDYDAFGNLIHSTGTTPNNFLFAGEQFDTALGLYYNRARYLDVKVGRFWGMDTYEGNSGNPISLHKYLYTNGNPVSGIDPSGNDDLAEVTAAEGIGESLDAENAETLEEAERASVPRPWALFDVTLAPGIQFFSHEFIWAKNSETGSGWGYHVIAVNPREMVNSRNLGVAIPGAFWVVPQEEIDYAQPQGPLPIESVIPITVLTDGQFGLWNAGAVTLGGICDLQTVGNALQGSFSYKIPDNTCKTWTRDAAALAISVSLLPF
jgi:RHS repeat-associated protein